VLALTVTDRESLLRALDGSSRVSQAGSRLVLGAFVRTAGRCLEPKTLMCRAFYDGP